MAQYSRADLYKSYRNGFHDKAFEHLVDSALNIKDDGIGVNNDYGLALTPKGGSKNLISFYEKISERATPLWTLSMGGKNQSNGLSIKEGSLSHFYIQTGGKVGIGTETPRYKLEVNGLMAAKGIVGTYSSGTVAADGEWHGVRKLDNIGGCQAFEIFAHINDEGDRRFGLTHAVMMISFGKRGYKKKVRTIDAGSNWLWGKFWNKIQLRWEIDEKSSTDDEDKYKIRIRTRGHYGMREGKPKKVFYRVTKLWDRQYENENHKFTWDEPQGQRPSLISDTSRNSGGQGFIKSSSGISIQKRKK